jgi:tight adherence protein C
MSLIPLLASAVVFVLIVYLGWLLMRRREQAAKRRSLAMVEGYAAHDVHGALEAARRRESLSREFFLGLGRALTTRKQRTRIERNTLFAGKNDPAIAEGILIRKVVYLIVGALLGLLLGYVGTGWWWLMLPVLGIAGFLVPDLLIYNQGLKRDEVMTKRLPDALDMLNLSVEAGLSFQAAMAQVAENQTGPVADEFGVALKEMQLGRSRAQALASLGGRTRSDDVKRFVSAMLQVDKIGVPVSTVLREQANEMRAKRYARAREQAQKLPVKILMPLMLCLLPALFIIILGPAGYSIYQVFSGGTL